MSRNLLTCIVVLSLLGGVVAYGFSDLVLWLSQPYFLSDGADLIATMVIILIVLVGMWVCSTADEKELEFFEQEAFKEEVAQKVEHYAKPMPPSAN